MTTAMQVVLLVVAILALQVAFWVPVLRWLRRRVERLNDQLRAELADETIVLGPGPALYRGSTGGFPKVKGNGVVVLTRDRLVFAKAIGDRIELPLDEVTGLGDGKWFARSHGSGRPHVILEAGEGRALGFIVEDHDEWMRVLRERLALDDDGTLAQ